MVTSDAASSYELDKSDGVNKKKQTLSQLNQSPSKSSSDQKISQSMFKIRSVTPVSLNRKKSKFVEQQTDDKAEEEVLNSNRAKKNTPIILFKKLTAKKSICQSGKMKSTSFKSSNDPNINDTPSSRSSEESTFIVKRPNQVMFEEPNDLRESNRDLIITQLSSVNKFALPDVKSRQSNLQYNSQDESQFDSLSGAKSQINLNSFNLLKHSTEVASLKSLIDSSRRKVMIFHSKKNSKLMDYIPQVSPQMESQKKEDELLFESRPAAKHTHNSRSNPDLMKLSTSQNKNKVISFKQSDQRI